MTLTVRPVTATDQEAWTGLYRGYREFYRLTPDDEVVQRTWRWVLGGEHELAGLVAVDGDAVLGFANIRRFARPSTGTMGIFLDDLYTTPEARGRGVATALLTRIAEIAHDSEASVVRWITADTNATARRLYDQVASKTSWLTYDMPPAS